MNLRSWRGVMPQLGERVYVDIAAVVIGQVVIGDDSSVWPCAVVRGDVAPIRIGARTSVQDGVVLHVTHDGPYTPGGLGLQIGDDVTIGHKAVLHACTVGNACLIGMGAVVPPGKHLPTRTLWAGNPARQVRALSPEQAARLRYGAEHYVRIKDEYLAM